MPNQWYTIRARRACVTDFCPGGMGGVWLLRSMMLTRNGCWHVGPSFITNLVQLMWACNHSSSMMFLYGQSCCPGAPGLASLFCASTAAARLGWAVGWFFARYSLVWTLQWDDKFRKGTLSLSLCFEIVITMFSHCSDAGVAPAPSATSRVVRRMCARGV